MPTVAPPTGDPTQDTTNIEQAMAASASDGSPLIFGPGHWQVCRPLTRRRAYTVRGDSMFGTVLLPTAAMVDQWVWTDEDMNRNGSRVLGDTTINWKRHKAGATLSDLSIVGDRSLGVIHGYRTTGTVDDHNVSNFGTYHLGGIGIRIGDPAPAKGLAKGGCIRESTFTNIRVEACGDTTNTTSSESDPVAGLPSFGFCQAQNLVGKTATDGSNQVNIFGLWTVYNYGRVWFRNTSAMEGMRRITIDDWMLHGPGRAGASLATDDLAVIEGLIDTFVVKGFRSNSGALNKALVRVTSHPGGGRPAVSFSSIGGLSAFGSAFNIEDADTIYLQGVSNPSGITQYEVTIGADSLLTPGKPAVGGGVIDLEAASGATAKRKINVPAACSQAVSVR